jgi:hypothetical protein
MIILITLGEVNEKASDWEGFCKAKGYDPYCVNEGAGSIQITLKEDEANKFGIINSK